MNWKPYWKVAGEGDKHCHNAQVFATQHEAEQSALARFMAWSMACDYGADPTEDPVNYRWDPTIGNVYVGEDRRAAS